MNIWQHCLLSQRKFGGQPQDYELIHSFLDASKYFYYHVKHRMLLHNLFGVELTVDLFGNFITNADGKVIMVRDIAVEHCREDLDGKIPTLYECWKDNIVLEELIHLPVIEDKVLQGFVLKPYLRSGLKACLIITCSDFGVFLAEKFLGPEKAQLLTSLLPKDYKARNFLTQFKFTERWQYSPQIEEIEWLKKVSP